MSPFFRRSAIVAASVVFMSGGALSAQDVEVPYWASIKAEEANGRVGPGSDYPISWVYQRKNLPVKVIKRLGNWRQVEDPDGTQTWMSSVLLSRQRTAMVVGKITAMRAAPSSDAKILWRVEPGVVGKLGECKNSLCEFDVNGRAGFVAEDSLWGDGTP